MKCCVPGCNSDSTCSPQSHGITFYMLPRKQSLRTAWLQVLGIQEPWKLNEKIAVCSEHFLCDDLYETKSGLLSLKPDAVPCIIQDWSNKECEDGPSVMVCRICLVMDTKLFSMREYKLEEAYEQLTGVSVMHEKQKLPNDLCAECAQRLIKFSQFRHKSLRANSLMVNLLNKHTELTERNIKSINRENNGLISNLTAATIIDNCDLYIEEVDEDIEATPEEEKPDILDLNTNIEENNEVKEEIDDVFLTKNEETDVEDDDYSSDNILFLEEMEKISEKYIKIEKVEESNVDEEEINNASNVKDDDYSTDNSLPVEKTKKKSTRKFQKKKLETYKYGEIKVDRRVKPYSDEFSKMFTVTDLTLRERLADLESRKESANYKNCHFKCTKCYKGFTNEITYNAHMVRHTTACGEYPCSICKIYFKSKKPRRNHYMRNHVQRFSCVICSYVTTYRESAKRHCEWHKGMKYSCPHCGEEFLKKSSFMGHVRIKHPSDFACELCGFSFLSEKGIQQHKQLKHRLHNEPIPEDGPYCDTCDIRFLDTAALNSHLSVSKRHFNADGKKRNEPSSVKRMVQLNIKKVGVDDGPITCEQCGVQLDTWRLYHTHFRNKHPEKNRTKYTSNIQLIMCEVCGKVFYSEYSLKDHKRIHEGVHNFKCEVCNKLFITKQGLVKHKHSIHGTKKRNTKLYECEECGQKFNWLGNKQRHMLIHKDIKSFICDICGKAFKQHREKRAHMVHVHFKVPWPKRIRDKRRKDGQEVKLANQHPATPVLDEERTDMEL